MLDEAAGLVTAGALGKVVAESVGVSVAVSVGEMTSLSPDDGVLDPPGLEHAPIARATPTTTTDPRIQLIRLRAMTPPVFLAWGP